MTLTVEVLGADGSTWDLLDPTSGVQLPGGIKGLHLPTLTGQWSTSAGLPGRRRRGRVVDARQAQLNVHVGDLRRPYRTGPDWHDLDDAWWTALGGGLDPFTLRIGTGRLDKLGRPDLRTLELWDESEDSGYSTYPGMDGSCDYQVLASPEAGFWSGPPVVATFTYQPGEDVDYYGGATGGGYGPPYYVGGGSPFDDATIDNPGEEEGHALWRIGGPYESASVGLPGGLTVDLPFGQLGSQQVTINTDPREWSIRDGAGNNLRSLVGPGLDPIFAPIPAGASIPLSITLDQPGAGAFVEVSVRPQYRRGM